MDTSDEQRLQDMLAHSREAVERLGDTGQETVQSNRLLELALTRLVMIIGEAASKVSEKTRKELPQLDWHRITGMRHRLVHDYLNVDLEILTRTVREELPSLINELEKVLDEERGEKR